MSNQYRMSVEINYLELHTAGYLGESPLMTAMKSKLQNKFNIVIMYLKKLEKAQNNI